MGERLWLTRERAFEASHRYWVPAWSREENEQHFGATTRPFGHGHNYLVAATVTGAADENGMLLNIKGLDQVLDVATARLDHRFINEECVDLLAGRQPTTEVLATIFWKLIDDDLTHAGPRADLATVQVAETPDLWAEVSRNAMPIVRMTRAYTFSAAHVLARPELDEAANRRVYGKCANPHGHGHDYRLEVTVAGEPDQLTGMVLSLDTLDAAVHETIVDPWDHRHLNREVAPFDRVVPTSENLLRVAWDLLRPRLGAALDKLTLYETPRGRFEYRGE